MDINAEVDAHIGEAEEDDRHEAPIVVDVSGSDLSILIGRRAETLEAAEFIALQISLAQILKSPNVS